MKTHVNINGKEISFKKEDDGMWITPVTQEQFNNLLLALDGLSFEKKEEQKPFSVDNPPKEGERYWFIGKHYEGYLYTNHTVYGDDIYDNNNLSQNNCFRTKEEAEAALSRVLQALKS